MIPPLLLDVQPHHLVCLLSIRVSFIFDLRSSLTPSSAGPRHVRGSRIQDRSAPRGPPRFLLFRRHFHPSLRSRRRQRLGSQAKSASRASERAAAKFERRRYQPRCFPGETLLKAGYEGRFLMRQRFFLLQFPKISLGPEGQAKYGQSSLQFDRILCDVPYVCLLLPSQLLVDTG